MFTMTLGFVTQVYAMSSGMHYHLVSSGSLVEEELDVLQQPVK